MLNLPNSYACTGCRESFSFPFRDACHYVGSQPIDTQVSELDLLWLPMRPGWCKRCSALCLIEDILPLRAFEDAYGAVRGGKPIEYPIQTEWMEREQAIYAVEGYLRWRMQRQHPARALCCGGADYQLLDVAQPLLKHSGCDYGVVQSTYVISSYCGPSPGVRSPANIRLYDAEGDLVRLLTWYKQEERLWSVEPAKYIPIVDD